MPLTSKIYTLLLGGTEAFNFMTSEERREQRYQRRKAARMAKKQQLNDLYGNFDEIISFDNLCDAFYECKKTVAWKASTQKYERNLFKNVYKTRQDIYDGKTISKGFHHFTLNERGKTRNIRSVHISERVVQKSVNRNCLLPILKTSLIYDNGASLKGKGVDFSHKRLVKHLRDFYKHHGTDGYILIIDFSGYFDNILHEPILEELDKKIFDKRIIELTKQFILPFGEKSLGLGSETSQILAINYPNKIDHYIKEVLRIHGYGRYMDDSYLIHESKEYLEYCLQEIIRLCDTLGIKLNKNKTQIVKLTHQFTYLKTKYNLTESGKILRRVSRVAVTRMRRKMKKFKRFYDRGLMTLKDIECSYQSWRGYLKRKNSYTTLCSLDKLYHDLFAHDIYMELVGRLQYA
jgi:hypothetical protein